MPSVEVFRAQSDSYKEGQTWLVAWGCWALIPQSAGVRDEEFERFGGYSNCEAYLGWPLASHAAPSALRNINMQTTLSLAENTSSTAGVTTTAACRATAP